MPIAALELAALLIVSAPAAAVDDAPARIPRGDRLVLQASTGGGYVPVDVARNQFPELTITGDGRVITLGPTTLEYPPRALPNLQVGRISRARVRALVKTAATLGLLDEEHPDYGDPQITDNPSTTVTVVADGERFTTSMYAPGYDGDDLTDEQRSNRTALLNFLGKASTTRRTKAYEPEAMAVVITRADVSQTPDSPAVQWPLGDLAVAAPAPGSDAGDFACIVVSGADLAGVLDAAATASTESSWISEGQQYDLVLRPLLPYQHDCADVN